MDSNKKGKNRLKRLRRALLLGEVLRPIEPLIDQKSVRTNLLHSARAIHGAKGPSQKFPLI